MQDAPGQTKATLAQQWGKIVWIQFTFPEEQLRSTEMEGQVVREVLVVLEVPGVLGLRQPLEVPDRQILLVVPFFRDDQLLHR